MNVNPFGLNSVYTKTNPSTMNANQSCGLHFGAGSGDYDCYQSSVPKKKENFWQKWKKWIIGGTIAVGVGILGIVGYNKGWFDKAKEAVKALSKTNPDNLGNDLEKALKTLEIESLTTGGKDIKSLLKNDTKIVTSNQFVDVAKEILSNKNLVKEEKNKTAAVKILEQLRKNLAQDAKIEGFDKSKEIKDISVLCNIINEPKIKTKIVLPNGEEDVEEPVEEPAEETAEETKPMEEEKPPAMSPSETPAAVVSEEFNQKLTKLDEKINNNSSLTIVTSDIVDLFNEPIPFDNINSEIVLLSKVLDTAMRMTIVEQKDIQNLLNGYIKNGTIKKGYIENFAFVLDTAINNEVFGDDKGKIQEYTKQLFENVDNNNAWAIANVLDTAINMGVFQNNEKLIRGYIKQLADNVDNNNAGVIADVLNTAIVNGVFGDNSDSITDDNKTTIQGHIKCLMDKVDKNNAGAIANLLINSIDKKVFGDSDKETIQNYIKQLADNVDSNNLNAIAGVLDTAMRMTIVEQKDIQNLLNGYIKNGTIKKEYIENFAFVLDTTMWHNVFDKDKGKIQEYIKCLIDKVDSNNLNAIAGVLDTAMRMKIVKQKDIQNLLNSYIENGTIKQEYIENFAFVLIFDIDLMKGNANQIDNSDKATIQDCIKQLVKNVDNNNAWAIANVLNNAIFNGVFGDNSDSITDDNKETIQCYIECLMNNVDSNNVNAITGVLNTAIRCNVFEEDKDEDKGKIQSYIKQLLDKIGNPSLIKSLLNDAKFKNLVDEQYIQQLDFSIGKTVRV